MRSKAGDDLSTRRVHRRGQGFKEGQQILLQGVVRAAGGPQAGDKMQVVDLDRGHLDISLKSQTSVLYMKILYTASGLGKRGSQRWEVISQPQCW